MIKFKDEKENNASIPYLSYLQSKQKKNRPNKKKRAKTIGFRAKMSTAGGRKVLSARRAKGRKELIRK